jgi:hypothetical protein
VTTLADVRRWNPAAVETAFAGLGTARDRLLDADADLAAAAPPPGWTGAAADGAGRQHGRLAEQLRRTVAGVTALRPALAGAADTITDLHRELALVDGLAAARGYRINPDGSVIAPPTAAGIPPWTAQLQAAELDEISTSIAGVLRRAEELDQALAAAVQAVADGRVDDGSGRSLLGAAEHVLGGERPPSPPPAGATPEQNAAWWARLTPAQRESVLLADPDLVGNRDGVPADVRDEANRTRLDTETARTDAAIAEARSRLAALPPPSPLRRMLEFQLDELEDQRDALTAIDDTVAADPTDRRLLLLDVTGHAEPRAAVALGDIGTADHVGVYTPGFTTTVTDSLPGVAADLSSLREQAQSQLDRAGRSGESVAAVAWLGYDIPQWDTPTTPDQSVAGSGAARAGGADLARFLDGVGAARPGDAPHLTALGHSYGSTTTGYALQQATGVDDAVLFGSPGLPVDDPAQLNVPPGHLSLLEAPGDPVADVGSTSQYNIAATVAGLPENRVGTADNSDTGDVVRGLVR